MPAPSHTELLTYIILLIITHKDGITNTKIIIKFTKVKFSFLTFSAIKKDIIHKINPPNIKDAINPIIKVNTKSIT